MAKTAKITLRRNRSYRRTLRWKVKASGAGVNCAALPLVFALRKPGAETPFFVLTVGDEATGKGSLFAATDAAAGVHSLLITNEETNAFSAFGKGEWSLSRIEGSEVIFMIGGELEVVNF